jgi:hypothetical protein
MTADDTTPRRAEAQASADKLFHEVLGLIDEIVERVTDDEVEARLRKVLDAGGYLTRAADASEPEVAGGVQSDDRRHTEKALPSLGATPSLGPRK